MGTLDEFINAGYFKNIVKMENIINDDYVCPI